MASRRSNISSGLFEWLVMTMEDIACSASKPRVYDDEGHVDKRDVDPGHQHTQAHEEAKLSQGPDHAGHVASAQSCKLETLSPKPCKP